jgi:hypothetical protein
MEFRGPRDVGTYHHVQRPSIGGIGTARMLSEEPIQRHDRGTVLAAPVAGDNKRRRQLIQRPIVDRDVRVPSYEILEGTDCGGGVPGAELSFSLPEEVVAVFDRLGDRSKPVRLPQCTVRRLGERRVIR